MKATITCQFPMLLGGFICIGCSSSAYDHATTPFLEEPSRLAFRYEVPFDKSWRRPDFEPENYDRILIMPVTLDFMSYPEKLAADPQRLAARRQANAMLADYARSEFAEVFRNDEQGRFEVVSEPKGQAIICEIALTEFAPARPLVNMAATGLSVVGSVVGQVAINAGGAVAKGTSRGVNAIEVCFRDAESGEPVFMFADRESGRPSLLNIKDFQQHGHAKAHIRTWAKQALAVLAREPGQTVFDTFPIEIKPW